MEFQYKGITYQMDENFWEGDMLNTTIDFQYQQIMYCISTQDWKTLENRITNMMLWGGILRCDSGIKS